MDMAMALGSSYDYGYGYVASARAVAGGSPRPGCSLACPSEHSKRAAAAKAKQMPVEIYDRPYVWPYVRGRLLHWNNTLIFMKLYIFLKFQNLYIVNSIYC